MKREIVCESEILAKSKQTDRISYSLLVKVGIAKR